ncbi:G0/G1 switch protein 2 [Amia ocellicauda]|uniref:G0/G1 switch protein 2 n=1 Tax=Amia ocellicauda TaxID=2972642 RepID=UPI003463A75B
METMQEFIPFAKEMLSQKPSRKMLKVYLVGSVLAFLGVVIGIVETVCTPFSSEEPLDEELERLADQGQRRLEEEEEEREREEAAARQTERLPPAKQQQPIVGQRNTANRLHAS